MNNFNWETLSLLFPEWAIDTRTGEKDKTFSRNFPETPNFSKGKIQFAFNNYGIELNLPVIPSWIKQTKCLERTYQKLSNQVCEDVSRELDKSFETLEQWRTFVKKYENGEWKGNLEDHLYFMNNNLVEMYDYFGSINKSPSHILSRINTLPKNSLNLKWVMYSMLSNNIVSSGSSTTCSTIKGETLSKCIANANEIYSYAQELSDLGLSS